MTWTSWKWSFSRQWWFWGVSPVRVILCCPTSLSRAIDSTQTSIYQIIEIVCLCIFYPSKKISLVGSQWPTSQIRMISLLAIKGQTVGTANLLQSMLPLKNCIQHPMGQLQGLIRVLGAHKVIKLSNHSAMVILSHAAWQTLVCRDPIHRANIPSGISASTVTSFYSPMII